MVVLGEMNGDAMQHAALIIFSPETSASQVKAIMNDLQAQLENDNHPVAAASGAGIELVHTKEFDPEFGGVVIYQP